MQEKKQTQTHGQRLARAAGDVSPEMEFTIRTLKEEFLSVYKRLERMDQTLWHSPGTLVRKGKQKQYPYYQYYISGQQFQKRILETAVDKVKERIKGLRALKEKRKEMRMELKRLKKALKALGVKWEKVLEDYAQLKQEKDEAAARREAARRAASQSIYPENYQHFTDAGFYVSSKSEQMISNELTKNGINYAYEKPLELEGHHLRPDFTITRKDGSIVYWEHLGMMDKPEYRQKFVWREKIYNRAGIERHRNLIITQDENGALDIEYVRHVIQDYRLV